LPPAFWNYRVHCHAACLKQFCKESRNALLRIFQVVAANLLAMHSAVTKQAPARKRFSASFGESFREKQQRSKTI
jgi:hypothetical protein